MLTAEPGVTNGVSALTTAYFNGSPVVVLAGRAPQWRWGAGSLQEIDHIPIVASITKHAATVTATDQVVAQVQAAVATALTPHRGPVFLDFPLDVIFSPGEARIAEPSPPPVLEPDPEEVGKADLQPGLRYDDVVRALGGAGETVSSAPQLGPALRRAFDAGVPYLVNVLTDPADAYPRSSSLA